MSDSPVLTAAIMRMGQDVTALGNCVTALTQGLHLMLEASQTQAVVLQHILEAVDPSVQDEAESPTAAALRTMAAAVRDNTAAVCAMRHALAGASLTGARLDEPDVGFNG